jgi:hypothetical protein
MNRHRGSRSGFAAILVAIALWFIQSPVATAEGIINYGGFGVDQPACGSDILPCATYDFARQQACNSSENNQDTYHVYHVYDGYISTCDMLGGTGREPTGAIDRNWRAYFLSLTLPLLAMFAVSLAASVVYYRRAAASA